MKITDHPSRAVLHRLAHALGVPVERFFAGERDTDVVVSTDECLRLWSKIMTNEGKQQALAALKALAASEES